MLLRTPRRRLSVLLAAGLLAATALAAGNSQAATDQTTGWQVGTPPLTTPWTADVSPTNAFTVPNNWKGLRLLLHFGAVDYDAKVWVNGRQVATHRGGYDGFDVDVTNVLHRSGPQELIVWAEDLTDETFQPIGKQRKVRARRRGHGVRRQTEGRDRQGQG